MLNLLNFNEKNQEIIYNALNNLTSDYDATSWKSIFPVALSASCSILMTRLDVLLVQNFLSPEEASSIAAAGRLNALFIFPLLALQQVLISHISKLQYISFEKLVPIQLIGVLIYSFLIFLFYYLFGGHINLDSFHRNSADNHLDERLAKGEITVEEYKELKIILKENTK